MGSRYCKKCEGLVGTWHAEGHDDGLDCALWVHLLPTPCPLGYMPRSSTYTVDQEEDIPLEMLHEEEAR